MTVGISDIGDRQCQEDAWLVARRLGSVLCAVCDGMGGGSSGRPAADLALKMLRAPFDKGAEIGRVLDAVEAANGAIFARTEAARRRDPGSDLRWVGAGTTADVAVFVGRRAHLAHVGDGRIYRFRGGVIERLTVEHTLENEYRAHFPRMTDAELAGLPKNVIMRALGMQEAVKIDRIEADASPGDRFVLCSDGLTSLVDDETIAALLARHPGPGAAARALVDAALEAPPYKDNITVVVHDVR